MDNFLIITSDEQVSLNLCVRLERSFILDVVLAIQGMMIFTLIENLNYVFLLSESSWPDENKFLYILNSNGWEQFINVMELLYGM